MRFLVLFFLASNICHGQDLKLAPLTKSEINKGIEYHYNYENADQHVAIIDLFLFKDGSFEYNLATNFYSAYSSGYWKISNSQLILNSHLQKNNLPVKVSYYPKENRDDDVKRINRIKDLRGNAIDYAFVYINNDSTSCMDGDLICIGEYEKIDSIRVRFENQGISSKWISIQPFDGVIQIVIETFRNLKNYLVFNNEKYKIDLDKLIAIADK